MSEKDLPKETLNVSFTYGAIMSKEWVESFTREQIDNYLRDLIEITPGKLDLDDPTPIAFDTKTGMWLNAKQLEKRNE